MTRALVRRWKIGVATVLAVGLALGLTLGIPLLTGESSEVLQQSLLATARRFRTHLVVRE